MFLIIQITVKNMDLLELLHTGYGMVGLALVGMFTHFIKKKVRGETVLAVTKYFTNHFKSTLIAVISTVVATLVYQHSMAEGGTADLLVVFFGGYNFDSFLNDHSEQKP